jgi:hypothetical protein
MVIFHSFVIFASVNLIKGRLSMAAVSLMLTIRIVILS